MLNDCDVHNWNKIYMYKNMNKIYDTSATYVYVVTKIVTKLKYESPESRDTRVSLIWLDSFVEGGVAVRQYMAYAKPTLRNSSLLKFLPKSKGS